MPFLREWHLFLASDQERWPYRRLGSRRQQGAKCSLAPDEHLSVQSLAPTPPALTSLRPPPRGRGGEGDTAARCPPLSDKGPARPPLTTRASAVLTLRAPSQAKHNSCAQHPCSWGRPEGGGGSWGRGANCRSENLQGKGLELKLSLPLFLPLESLVKKMQEMRGKGVMLLETDNN